MAESENKGVRRRRAWIVGTVGAVLLLTSLGTLQLVDRAYDPLVTNIIRVRNARYESGPGRKLRYEHGRTFRYVFDVTNAGEHTVKVEGVHLPLRPGSGYEFLIDHMGLLMGREPGLEAPPVRFEPFELRPGETRLLYVEARFANCRGWWPRDTMGISGHVIETSFLGIESRTRLRLVDRIEIAGPAADDCPERPRGWGRVSF